MSDEKISPDAILILELEGLAPAVNEVGALLRGHGLSKHGHRRWKKLSKKKLRKKGVRHLKHQGIDEESGKCCL